MRDAQAGAAVLVVDADTRERSAVRGMLAPLGYRIAGAESQADALRAVAHERFAVIVMDTRRESLDGYETAKRIREQTGTELTPIIFLTAFGDDELETAAAYASGAVDFVFTPVVAAVLRAKVSTFMKLVIRSQQLEDSVESIMELNSALVDSEVRGERCWRTWRRGSSPRSSRHRVAPVGPAPVRLPRRGEMLRRRRDGSETPAQDGSAAGHEPDADRRPHVHDRLRPRHHRSQPALRAGSGRVRRGADRQRHHLPRRPDRARQPGRLRDDGAHLRAARRRRPRRSR